MIFVTGATGFLGSRLVYDLAREGKNVRALKRHGSAIPSILKNIHGIEWIEGDVLDLLSLEQAMQGIQEVYHCAGIVSFDPSLKSRMLQVNIQGTANVVNTALALNIRKLVHVSSIAALGSGKPGELITEESVWEYAPRGSAYALSKFEGEREVQRAMEEGLSAVIVNPSVIIGPGNWKSDSSALFSKAHAGNYFYPAGTMGFTDVRDVSLAMIRLMNSNVEGERFIISAENWSFYELLRTTAAELNCRLPRWKAGPRLLHVASGLAGIYAFLFRKPLLLNRSTVRAVSQDLRYSNEKIKKNTGMTFIPVAMSIRDTGRLFLEQQKADHFLSSSRETELIQ